MAPVLQCPECGTKHPLDAIGDRSAFPCGGCGRTLKVPEQARVPGVEAPVAASTPAAVPTPAPVPPGPRAAAAAPSRPAPSSALFDHEATGALGPVSPPGTLPPLRSPAPPPGAFNPIPRVWIRFLLWIVAVPLGFFVVFAGARLFGVLNSAQLEDVWLATGWGRFLPIARLLPFVALVTAGVVHGAVLGIARVRRRRHPAANTNGRSPARSQSSAPPASRKGS